MAILHKKAKQYVVTEVVSYKYSDTSYYQKKFFDNLDDAVNYRDANNAVAALEDDKHSKFMIYGLLESDKTL
jgi:hypothetical protein